MNRENLLLQLTVWFLCCMMKVKRAMPGPWMNKKPRRHSGRLVSKMASQMRWSLISETCDGTRSKKVMPICLLFLVTNSVNWHYQPAYLTETFEGSLLISEATIMNTQDLVPAMKMMPFRVLVPDEVAHPLPHAWMSFLMISF